MISLTYSFYLITYDLKILGATWTRLFHLV